MYCPHCFSIITWENPDDEHYSAGRKMIVCPYCKKTIDIVKDSVVFIEKDIIENPKVYVNGVAYTTFTEAIDNLKPNDTLVLTEDVSVNSLALNDVNIDLNNHSITTTQTISLKGNSVLSNGTLVTTSPSFDAIVANKDSIVTLSNMTVTSKRNGVTADGGKIILNNSSVTAQEAAILALDGATVEVNGGEYTTIDNGPIMTNGTRGRGNNNIIVNGGTFTGNITSAGYLPFVVYLANNDGLTVNSGTFNVENGSAFVVRGGYLNIKPGVTINATGTGTGKVGDGSQPVPAGYDIVIDYKSKYPEVNSINVVAPNRNIHIIEA